MLAALWLAFTTFAKGPLLSFLKLAWGWLMVVVSVPAWALVLALVLGFGWHVRHQGAAVDAAVAKVEAKHAKELADTEVLAKADYARELRNAGVVGAKIVSALLDVAAARSRVEIRTQTIVKEVGRVVDQTPALAGPDCAVPDPVLQLRIEQYEAIDAATGSSATAGDNRSGPGVLPAPGT